MESRVYTASITAKGRVVVPQPLRESLKVKEGDTILFIEDEVGIRVTTRAALVQELAGSLAEDDGRDFTSELLQERREEAEREKGHE
ncbi:looped-hinge helix DNA binding domain, AbrB family (plasmid) [Deinococcus peraridilitoris DSM 19664]|uniref:Looped-hinge helix DNA binding domain, AbrB family n=2 Tax=Deinococcus TaxID=1298 RepID=L0A8D7_DEIPD|nr:looped-hinge helix DNA binding domain, AbrB family [Deinococcus peraridilitoris DSM 19664]